MKTYGSATSDISRIPNNPLITRKDYRVSSSPPDTAAVQAGPSRIAQRRAIHELSSDEEMEEPIEERHKDSRQAISAQTSVSVILPARHRISSSAERHSPDPLDSLGGSSETPSRAAAASSSRVPASVSRTASTSKTSQRSAGTAESTSVRVSRRVQDAMAKKEAEKEERRRKRREEKEKKAEAERKKAEKEKLRGMGSGAGETEAPQYTRSTREERGNRRQSALRSSPAKEPDRLESVEPEIPPVALETVLDDGPLSAPGLPKSSADDGVGDHIVEDEIVKPTAKGKKRKLVVEEEDEDEDEEPILGTKGQLQETGERVQRSHDQSGSTTTTAPAKKEKAPPAKKGKGVTTMAKSEANTQKLVDAQQREKEESGDIVQPPIVEEDQNEHADVSAQCFSSCSLVISQPERTKSPSVDLPPSAFATVSTASSSTPSRPLSRSPLKAASSNVSIPVHRPSPGPVDAKGIPAAPGGIQWRTSKSIPYRLAQACPC